MEQALLADVDLKGVPIKVGQLWSHYRHGRESMTLEYNRDWLKHPQRFSLDPALQLVSGPFHASPEWTTLPPTDGAAY
jgi:serine/threonine-protein kinase HipA